MELQGVRELRLRRRRSRTRWIYLLYQVRARSALTAQERGDVERGRQLEAADQILA
jgi:hypothetical protein